MKLKRETYRDYDPLTYQSVRNAAYELNTQFGLIPKIEMTLPIIKMEELIVNEFHISGASAPQLGTTAALTGSLGQIGGFNLLVSQNVPNDSGTKYKILFGTARAITFASQVNDIRLLEIEKQFGRKVDGEYVFGRKVVRPECLGVMTCNFS